MIRPLQITFGSKHSFYPATLFSLILVFMTGMATADSLSDRDKTDQITGFRMDTGRVRNLKFFKRTS